MQTKRNLKIASIFSGIGGIELGMEKCGHKTTFMCEIDKYANMVLNKHFPGIERHEDILTLKTLPKVDLITAGFPCQDISLAGTRKGLEGHRSGLVINLFQLIKKSKPELVLLENVHNLLRLNKGKALFEVLDLFESCGYKWAYRLVDTRGFGLPQRRLRVFILGSKGDVNPENILFNDNQVNLANDSMTNMELGHQYGFYWTEGKRGVGWANNSIPPIKGGSALGIPSPPAIFDTINQIAYTPNIIDAERLQGFPVNWTNVYENGANIKEGIRWKMIGNAVSVPAAEWIGLNLYKNPDCSNFDFTSWSNLKTVPSAGFGGSGKRFVAKTTTHPLSDNHIPIGEFLKHPIKPLSNRALAGYISRAKEGAKVFPSGFLEALQKQLLNESILKNV